MESDHATLTDWTGRTEEAEDIVSAGAVKALVATLSSQEIAPQSGDAAPLLSHWLHFLPSVPQSNLGADGHPARGAFLPPVTLPRRMWASSALQFVRPLLIGSPVTRRSTIASVTERTGRSGSLVFVEVDHVVSDAEGPVVSERQTIVYRSAPTPGAPSPAPVPAPQSSQWSRRIDPDPVLLFRYSALTFNGHRIHYDQPYATGVEGYPGLVVHGPLIATLLLHELTARHPGLSVTGYRFRAVSPLFDTAPFHICGALEADGTARLFATNESGALCMDAAATFS
ncbi:MaoC family dehydratase N-terminal domain-containing protein [Novosphingobium sp. MMS21-SN21R]|uniref:FAS1-like dehydratase domain-containing protein n=1 Tax=Novosphingobium sp. MMS21-SN21R TaxID=2969298 RepID=UPI0028859E08|nr:MaoC family dehydratase N-terminal domain-containing protein [Novosphingobium sp. MMS21-SN21R]MDT0509944.1 MaoC family dehydratase N-terminal domain-containing protein [Novosphingobium sp. MMS21-SN21R]